MARRRRHFFWDVGVFLQEKHVPGPPQAENFWGMWGVFLTGKTRSRVHFERVFCLKQLPKSSKFSASGGGMTKFSPYKAKRNTKNSPLTLRIRGGNITRFPPLTLRIRGGNIIDFGVSPPIGGEKSPLVSPSPRHIQTKKL